MLRKSLLVAVAAALPGCYSLSLAVPGADPDSVQLTAPKNARTVKRFSEGRLVWHLLFGLIPLGNGDLSDLLAPRLKDNHRVANLKVSTSTWFDIGLVSLTSISVEGDEIVKR
ncbi:MAG: hypothetical protein FJZ01_18000 [Candidatus Sericytochromatia bacterium]|nr:hypothetical protein [Candidatus Tanganyikabacteria bacterium]